MNSGRIHERFDERISSNPLSDAGSKFDAENFFVFEAALRAVEQIKLIERINIFNNNSDKS